MRSNVLLLLAVCSNLVTAGLVRRGPLLRSQNYPRALNQSSIPAAAQLQSSTNDISSATTSAVPFKAGSASTGVSPVSASKQVGSVPVAGSGPDAASIPASELSTANTDPPNALSTAAPAPSSVSPLSSPKSSNSAGNDKEAPKAAPSKQVGSVPVVGSGPDAATIPASAIQSANTEPPKPLATATPVSSPTSLPSSAQSSPSAANNEAPKVVSSKQVGSVPAGGSGPGAATLSASEIKSANTEPPQPISTIASTPSSTILSPSAASSSDEQHTTTSNKGGLVVAGSIIPSSTSKDIVTTESTTSFSRRFSLIGAPGNQTTAVPRATGTDSVTSLVSSPTQSLVSSTTSDASSAAGFNTTTIPQNTSTVSQASPPTITGGPEAKDGNLAMAKSFNAFFKIMALGTTCNPSINSQASACINDQLAQCGSDGKYSLSPCPPGQQCYALPLDDGQSGVSIQCARPSDADAKLGQGTSSGESSVSSASTSQAGSASQANSASSASQPSGSTEKPQPTTFSTKTQTSRIPSPQPKETVTVTKYSSSKKSVSATPTNPKSSKTSPSHKASPDPASSPISKSSTKNPVPTPHTSKSSSPSAPSSNPQPSPSPPPPPSISISIPIPIPASPPPQSQPPKPTPTPAAIPEIIITDLSNGSPDKIAVFITRTTRSPSPSGVVSPPLALEQAADLNRAALGPAALSPVTVTVTQTEIIIRTAGGGGY